MLCCFQLQSRLWNWEGWGGHIYRRRRRKRWQWRRGECFFGVTVRAQDVRNRTVDRDDTAVSVKSSFCRLLVFMGAAGEWIFHA